MTSVSRKKRILTVVLCAFVCAGTAAIVAFMAVVVPSQYADQATIAAASLHTAQPGDSVLLGAYEQDNDPANGKEPIEWIVLTAKEDRLLLLSRFALDCVQFSDAVTMATWDYSSILTWLNDLFYNEAFNSAEKTLVLSSDVKADKNPVFDTDPGKKTSAKVFLLSITEAYRYMHTDKARQCQATAYAEAKGARTDGEYCTWWLRSPGYDASVASRVLTDGRINYCGYPIADDGNSVRPCVWVKAG